jgi:hypothetical protein
MMVRGHLALLLLLPGLVAAPSVAAQQRGVWARQVEPTVAIRLWLPDGFAEIRGWDHDSIEVRSTAADGDRFLAGGTATAVKLAAESRTAPDAGLASARVRIFLPRRARLWVKSTIASVDVAGLAGELDILTVTGGIAVADTKGVVTVESIEGSVTLSRLDGVIRLRGGAGETRLTDLAGRLDASLVSGTVHLTGQVGVSGQLETVGGAIWVVGTLVPGARLALTTHDGAVRVIANGAAPPRLETEAAGAVIDPTMRTAPETNGIIVITSYKGSVNAVRGSGT